MDGREDGEAGQQPGPAHEKAHGQRRLQGLDFVLRAVGDNRGVLIRTVASLNLCQSSPEKQNIHNHVNICIHIIIYVYVCVYTCVNVGVSSTFLRSGGEDPNAPFRGDTYIYIHMIIATPRSAF